MLTANTVIIRPHSQAPPITSVVSCLSACRASSKARVANNVARPNIAKVSNFYGRKGVHDLPANWKTG